MFLRISPSPEVFEDIEQQNEMVPSAGLKILVEWRDVDFVEVRIGGIDDVAARFDAFDVAELGQFAEE